jgi:hypothetical protein
MAVTYKHIYIYINVYASSVHYYYNTRRQKTVLVLARARVCVRVFVYNIISRKRHTRTHVTENFNTKIPHEEVSAGAEKKNVYKMTITMITIIGHREYIVVA